MIEMNKKYKTRDGRDIRILCIDRPHISHPVVGYTDNGVVYYWTKEGLSVPQPQFAYQKDYDLIEVKEKKRLKGWLEVFDIDVVAFTLQKPEPISRTVAIILIDIEYEEGDGLR